MRRFDLEDISPPSSYERHDAMVERADGDWIQHDDHVAALAAANERLLDALRREKAALDAAEKAREFYLKHTAELNAEITRLGNVIGEMCE